MSAMQRQSTVGKDVSFERIRRITGYLVGTMDKWNDAKKAEEHEHRPIFEGKVGQRIVSTNWINMNHITYILYSDEFDYFILSYTLILISHSYYSYSLTFLLIIILNCVMCLFVIVFDN